MPIKPKAHDDYAERRSQAYPPIGDQLDAVRRLAETLRDIVQLPKEVEQWLNVLQKVKRRFPKP
ncbi:hypothetical protein ACIPK7_05265 [Pseudomonas sp. NPDC086581]|uniref:hypothetical protein n=1 Tax=Pseudomonas sp. NPDC086581 TaxID=3364432 RepID=UPI0038299276